MPIRKQGNTGFLPLPGWDPANDWQGFHPVHDLPRVLNPEEGFVVTANEDLNHLGNVSPINVAMGPYRSNRIKELIKAKRHLEIQDFKDMHYDLYSLQAEKFMEIIRPLLPDTEAGKILADWDLKYSPDSKGASTFEMVYRSLYFEVFGQAMHIELEDFLEGNTGLFIDFYDNFDGVLLAEESKWFGERSREEIYRAAIATGLSYPVQTWGEVNNIMLSHILLGGQMPSFLKFDRGPFPLPGGRSTIHQGQSFEAAGRATSFAPSYRLITDMGEHVVHTNFPGGATDRRFSKYYNSDWENWQKGRYRVTKYEG